MRLLIFVITRREPLGHWVYLLRSLRDSMFVSLAWAKGSIALSLNRVNGCDVASFLAASGLEVAIFATFLGRPLAFFDSFWFILIESWLLLYVSRINSLPLLFLRNGNSKAGEMCALIC